MGADGLAGLDFEAVETAAKRLALRIMGQVLAGLERAWYHCQRCHTGSSPRDRALALEGTSLSPAALRMTGLAAARVSFAETGALLRELAGLDLEPKRVERQAEALGREIADDERQVIEPEPGSMTSGNAAQSPNNPYSQICRAPGPRERRRGGCGR